MAGASSSLKTLREEAAHCRACPLWKNATQTVFGQGPPHAQAMLVGEQPGDKEDLAGKSFVGPAGQMLDRALEEASIDRKKVYVTNAVKHFKFVLRGKIRLHQKPTTPEIKACRQWYEREGDQTRSGGGNGCYISTKRVREDHAHQQKPWPPA
jgi:DNA polymerase